MLTKQESKFRTKIIQERHLKKIDQITLDYTVKNSEYLTYKLVYTIGFAISIDKLCDGFNAVCEAAKKMLDAMADGINCALGNMAKNYERLVDKSEL
jgi:hypothetical protein